MANVSTINVPQGDFVTTTLIGAITNSSTSFTIGSGLTLDPNGGFLQIDYDSILAIGVTSGPETVAYTSYNSGTGAVTGVTRAQASTVAVAHNNNCNVQCGSSVMYYLNGSVLGYAEITSSYSTTTTPSITDVPGLSVTVVVPQGTTRRIRVTVQPGYIKTSAAAGTTMGLYIREGSTTLQNSLVDQPVSNYACGISCTWSEIVTAGSHTYKASISQSAAGTIQLGSTGTTGPAYIMCELL